MHTWNIVSGRDKFYVLAEIFGALKPLIPVRENLITTILYKLFIRLELRGFWLCVRRYIRVAQKVFIWLVTARIQKTETKDFKEQVEILMKTQNWIHPAWNINLSLPTNNSFAPSISCSHINRSVQWRNKWDLSLWTIQEGVFSIKRLSKTVTWVLIEMLPHWGVANLCSEIWCIIKKK